MKEFYDLTFKDLVNGDRMRNGLAFYTPGQIEELKANIMASVMKLGVIMSPDVMGVAVNQMVEMLVMEEYHYVSDLFETVGYEPGYANGENLLTGGADKVFTDKDRKAFEQTPTVKDTGKMAIGLPLNALKAVAKKGNKNGISKKSTRR